MKSKPKETKTTLTLVVSLAGETAWMAKRHVELKGNQFSEQALEQLVIMLGAQALNDLLTLLGIVQDEEAT